MSKKLLLLGGSRYLFPVIDAAHNLDVEVITADYLPDNVAHRKSDRYCNVSIVDKEAVLRCAADLNVDGIMSFAADPGVMAGAYAAEKLGLPFQGSYKSVSILQHKDKFRAFLKNNSFNTPSVWVIKEPLKLYEIEDSIEYPVIVKPTDSAGSKGCSKVCDRSSLRQAVDYALRFSLSKTCIIEQFLETKGSSSDADAFTIDGRFECVSFTSQLFDKLSPNPFTPAAYVMPSRMPSNMQEELKRELQRMADLLCLKTGIYNIETRIATNGMPYIMEVSPRGGGNRLAEMLKYATGAKIDLISASVKAALGLPINTVNQPCFESIWYQEVLHSNVSGHFARLDFDSAFKNEHVVDLEISIEKGEKVKKFESANHSFGSVMMKFGSYDELNSFLANKNDLMRVIVE